MTRIFAKTALLPSGWQEQVAVEIDSGGKISAIDDMSALQSADHQVDVLLPAPVNAHSHAFQRAMAGLTEYRSSGSQDDFWSWRKLMYHFLERLTPEDVEAIAAQVQMEMLEAGYSTCVEFHYVHHQPNGAEYDNPAEMAERIAAASAQTGIGLTLLPVLYQYGGCDQRPLEGGQVRFGNNLEQFLRLHEHAERSVNQLPHDCRIGVAPHSLRAVAKEDLSKLSDWAKNMPIHLHLAEQQEEVVEVLASWNQRPVQWLLQNVSVDKRWCLIHCTQMHPDETVGLAHTGAVAGMCPITESNLGDGIFDGTRWQDAGGAMAIGSDSNIRISLTEELRTLDYSQRLRDHSRAPFATETKSSGRTLFEAVVKGGAQAAGRTSGCIDAGGCIEVGQYADLLSLADTNHYLIGRKEDSILDSLIYAGDDSLVQDLWCSGRHMVRNGRHIHRDEIASRYRLAMKRLLAS